MKLLFALAAYCLFVSYGYLQESHRLSEKTDCILKANPADLTPCDRVYGPSTIQKPWLVPTRLHNALVSSA